MKKNKKGFTLAELLIVVAIIAVLTAIAVPLFVSALKKAEDAVEDANIRAVRGEAVSQILLADKTTATNIYNGGKLADQWYVYAEVSSNGEIKTIAINWDDTKMSKASGATVTGSCNKEGDVYIVKLLIKADSIKDTTTTE